ncbi:MAG: phosphoribosyltransferase [Candidatus Hermodarchaeia archaeon]|jgi:hypoxanthine phosphoribosyltransferase
MVEPIKCQFVSYDDIYDYSKKLAFKVTDSGYNPDLLLAIARSGFVPGRLMSDFMGNPNLYALKVEHWLDTTAEHQEDAIIPVRSPLPVKGQRVLVIDDIVDTGRSAVQTLKYVNDLGAKEAKLAVMLYLTVSEIEPDYYTVKESEWIWFIWFWNRFEDLRNLTIKLFDGDKNRSLSIKDITKGLKQYFTLDVDQKELKQVIETAGRIGKLRVADLDNITLL